VGHHHASERLRRGRRANEDGAGSAPRPDADATNVYQWTSRVKCGHRHRYGLVGPAISRLTILHAQPDCDADSNTDGDVSRHDVLILSTDPLAAALLGAAVEFAGRAPRFALPAEGARAALLRLRPGAVVIDCDHDEACSDAFVGPALMTGARVHFVRSGRTRRDVAATARRLGVRVIDLPLEHETLASLLEDLPISSP
jgi:hypothetical protein